MADRRLTPPFPIVSIAGAPFERGVSYGEQASGNIARSLAFYERAFPATSDISLAAVCDQVRNYHRAWQTAEPELLREIDGIAHGSRQPLDAILALNARDTFMHRSTRTDAARDFDDGCTSWAVLPRVSLDGDMRIGQNWDYLDGIRDTVVLLHVTPETGPAQLIIVEAGQIGRQGANTRGVGLQANGLPTPTRQDDALPNPIVRRQILGAANYEAALTAALRPPRAGFSNLLVADREGLAVDLEARLQTVRWLMPESGFIAHGNHFQADIPGEMAETYVPLADSLIRYARASELLQQAKSSGGIGMADLMALGRDHAGGPNAICRHLLDSDDTSDRWMTISSVITDLTRGIMHVASGPPCEHPYVPIDIGTGRLLLQAELSPQAASA